MSMLIDAYRFGGGGGGGWTPADLPNLRAWYDVDLSPHTLSGSNVTQWDDLSGNAIHATASGIIPYSSANHWLEFGGSSWLIPSAALLTSGNSPLTLACAYRDGSVDGTGSHIYGQGPYGISNEIPHFGKPGAGAGTRRLRFGTWAGDLETADNAFAADTDMVVIHRYTSGSRAIYKDGTSMASDSYSSANFGTSTPRIGAAGEIGQPLVGKMRTFIVCTSSLSTNDRQKLEGYLAHRWGTASSLPSGHPYKSSPP